MDEAKFERMKSMTMSPDNETYSPNTNSVNKDVKSIIETADSCDVSKASRLLRKLSEDESITLSANADTKKPYKLEIMYTAQKYYRIKQTIYGHELPSRVVPVEQAAAEFADFKKLVGDANDITATIKGSELYSSIPVMHVEDRMMRDYEDDSQHIMSICYTTVPSSVSKDNKAYFMCDSKDIVSISGIETPSVEDAQRIVHGIPGMSLNVKVRNGKEINVRVRNDEGKYDWVKMTGGQLSACHSEYADDLKAKISQIDSKSDKSTDASSQLEAQ